MRPRNVKQSMQRYAAAVVSFSLLMAVYTGVRPDSNPIPARTLRGSDTSMATSRMELSASSARPVEGSKAWSPQRKMALRDRGLNAQVQDEQLSENQDAWLFLTILSSVIYGAILSKRALSRWIAWEEAERIVHAVEKDDFNIVFSHSTNEIGYQYGSYCGSPDWTSDITKFDV